MTESNSKTSYGMDELLQAHTGNEGGARLYEVGFHIVPSVAEEAVAAEVAKIKDGIVAEGGSIIGEEMPKKTALAYTIGRLIGGKRVFFDASYFGWVRFEMAQDNLALFDRSLRGSESVLRHLILQVKPMEKVSPVTRKMPFFGSKAIGHDGAKGEGVIAGESKAKETHTPSLSEAELDKTIEELIAE